MSIGARKPVLPVIAVCCVLVGWFVWSAVPALAVAPETPEVSVEALVPPTTATVHGVLNPGVEGAPGTYELGTYEFLYKQGKAGCEGEGKAPASPGISLGAGKEAVSETLSGLSPGSEYSLCLLVRDGVKGEQAVSAPVKFTTVPVVEVPVTTEPATAVAATSATFEGELSPGGTVGSLTYQFDYNTNGTCVGGQSTVPVEVAEAKQLHVSGTAVGLEPNDTYRFCLVATNMFGEQVQGNEVSLQTGRQAPVITGVSVTNTTSSEATVNGEIYPYGEATTYRVEYGPTNTYGSSTPEASISAQHGPADIQTQLTGLTPNTEYHYRILTTNHTGSEQSPDATFTTSEAIVVGSQGLPDNRAYEMVTPPFNEDANVYVPLSYGFSNEAVNGSVQTFHLFQVAGDGSGVAYIGDATSGGGNGEGGTGIGNQFLASRLAGGGWVTKSIQPPGAFVTEYEGFSSDLSVGVLESSGTSVETKDLLLSEEALGDGYGVLYARTASESTYRPLFTKAVQPTRITGFGSNLTVNKLGRESSSPVFAGGSASFSDLLFEANDALLGGDGVLESELQGDVKAEIAKGENKNYLYDSAEGKLSLIDVSPEGRVVPDATIGAPPDAYPLYLNPPNFGGAISADGDRVYWSSLETTGENLNVVRDIMERPTGLYLRENPGGPQSPVVNGECSVPSDACTVQVSAGEAQYWASAANGRYAFYSEGGGLYRFDAEPGPGGSSRRVLASPDAGVMGVLGASEDGEDVYFVATEVLAAGNSEGADPVEGEPNLYLSHDGNSPVFIATLSVRDGSGVLPFSEFGGTFGNFGDWQPGLGHRTARVTGDGAAVVFMSERSLGVVGYPHGYPNMGANEIYVYEAGSNSLFCASCGSTREGASGYLPVSWGDSTLPQWISEDGNRVFFDSSSALVSQDTNGEQDVYEWEREGTGTCTNSISVNGSCVFLLSGGTSKAASWLIGAGETGNDVFVATRAQLVSEDQNDAFDLYDVRVDGVKPVSPPQCTGSGCQGVPAPPPTFATPSSVTFNGVGNFPPATTVTVKAKAKPGSRAQKLASALRACRKTSKRKRASCEARARKRYGPLKKTRKSPGTVVKGRK